MRGESYRHRQQPRLLVLQVEVLVGKGLGAVYAGRAGAIAVKEITALAHEIWDLFPRAR